MAKQPILSGSVVRERPMCTLNPSTRQWKLLMMTVANDRARVAQNDETIENLKRNRRRTNRSIAAMPSIPRPWTSSTRVLTRAMAPARLS